MASCPWYLSCQYGCFRVSRALHVGEERTESAEPGGGGSWARAERASARTASRLNILNEREVPSAVRGKREEECSREASSSVRCRAEARNPFNMRRPRLRGTDWQKTREDALLRTVTTIELTSLVGKIMASRRRCNKIEAQSMQHWDNKQSFPLHIHCTRQPCPTLMRATFTSK